MDQMAIYRATHSLQKNLHRTPNDESIWMIHAVNLINYLWKL